MTKIPPTRQIAYKRMVNGVETTFYSPAVTPLTPSPGPSPTTRKVHTAKKIDLPLCGNLGTVTGETSPCVRCHLIPEQPIHFCSVHGKCTVKERTKAGHHVCEWCSEHTARQQPTSKPLPAVMPKQPTELVWSCGVTTVSSRVDTTLPETLRSLSKAGFPSPRLFLDDATLSTALWLTETYQCEVTPRIPKVGTVKNWILSIVEVYLRNPHADRFALFQDDLIASKNLRLYLDRVEFPKDGYLNLYTFPRNEPAEMRRLMDRNAPPQTVKGFYPANKSKRGLSALALVFTRDGLKALFSNSHLFTKPQDKVRGHRAIDGGIVDAMAKAGWQEYCHSPSLVQHTGHVTSMGSQKQPLAVSFRGEEFDCLSLL